MKKQSFIFFLITLCAAFIVVGAYADETFENIESMTIDDFDSAETLNGSDRAFTWTIRASKFIGTTGEGDSKELDLEWKLVPGYPSALYKRDDAEGKDLNVIGVRGGFTRKGFNYLEFIPVGKDTSDGEKLYPIELRGRIKTVSMWVWGANFNYYIDIHLRDSNGIDHTIRLGDTKFEGWRNLSVHIPTAIAQVKRYTTKGEALSLTKIVVWTRPGEKVDNFYIYFDQLRMVTDTFITKFDGDELADVEKIWASDGQ
ncbi:MAG: hypothetical protein EHM28_08600 [Spirochaetaceae bacterium]|nr:MAG: hypothetical protein EHM28_08600 [Spirochaetaceae bacterium]